MENAPKISLCAVPCCILFYDFKSYHLQLDVLKIFSKFRGLIPTFGKSSEAEISIFLKKVQRTFSGCWGLYLRDSLVEKF